MLRSWLKDKKLLFLLAACLVIKLFSTNEGWVERYYTYGIYPFISSCLRLALGWTTISIGDVFYTVAGAYGAIKLALFIKLLYQKKVTRALLSAKALKLVKLLLFIYFLFNVLWGLNYNRLGVQYQLKLTVVPYSENDLKELLFVLNDRLCFYGDRANIAERRQLQNHAVLFTEGVRVFDKSSQQYPFLTYTNASLKPSLYSPLGHYFGFTGYYNPFTAEAQIKTSIPVFLKPFVLCHEIGHQVGYAKENEANFISFLTARKSDNQTFRYAAYFEMWLYAWRELMRRDAKQSILLLKTAHPQVQKDYGAFIAYLTRTNNEVEPYISQFYDQYLKINNQPKGKATYNDVVAWMVAYMKKMGKAAI